MPYLANELIFEISHFLPYKEFREKNGIRFYDNPKKGPILASFALSYAYVKHLREIKKRRHNKITHLAKGIKPVYAHEFPRTPYFLLNELDHYWDRPINGKALCVLCFRWDTYDSSFTLCIMKTHSMHKKCRNIFPCCVVCCPHWSYELLNCCIY